MPYHYQTLEEFVVNFKQTHYYELIKQEFGIDYFSSSVKPHKYLDDNINYHVSPREHQLFRVFNIDALFYLDKLYNNPSLTYHDIGCGANIFKRIFKGCGTTIGYDPNNPNADQKITFEEFYNSCQQLNNKVDRIYAINSLHFSSLYELDQIITIMNPGAVCFMTFNTMASLYSGKRPEYTSMTHEEKMKDVLKITNIIDNIFASYKDIKTLYRDIILAPNVNHINGNIMLLFEKGF